MDRLPGKKLMKITTLKYDESGAVFVELAVLLPVLITVLFGSVDLLFAFHQWNAGAKAVEVGARISNGVRSCGGRSEQT